MSHITDVILTVCLLEDESIVREIQRRVEDEKLFDRYRSAFLKVDELKAGGHVMQCSIYINSYNYLDMVRFVEIVRDMPWKYPDLVQCFMKDENEEVFTDRMRVRFHPEYYEGKDE